jgi:hypothetical protein
MFQSGLEDTELFWNVLDVYEKNFERNAHNEIG